MSITVPPDYVYLDWAATAPLCEEAREAMQPFMVAGPANLALGGNANSLHAPGRAAFEALEYARRDIAACINASRPNEVLFTSGATEADNTALFGIATAMADTQRRQLGSGAGTGFVSHLITTAIEHDAVLAPAKKLESLGWQVTYLAPDKSGFIAPDALQAALDAAPLGKTSLVSVQMANSEVGSIQPIAQLAEIAHSAGALFHTDATQALGKIPLDVQALGVDAASFSAHKICGPKGIGALYVKARTPLDWFMGGGGQEEGRRSGTQNVCGAAGFAAACKAACGNLAAEAAREAELQSYLYQQLCAHKGVAATVDLSAGSYLPNIVHVLVDGLESETMVLRLDMLGFGVSGGSACSSHSLSPSHVLRAMGISADRAYSALRISLGRFTTRADIDAFVKAFESCLEWR